MSYAKRVAYNTVAQIVGRLVTTVTSLATVSLLNATLKPEGWGSYVALTTYLGFFAVLADMGINLLYLREISREPEHIDEITSRFLGFRLVTAALVLLVIAPLIGMLVPVYHAFLLPIFLLAVGQFILTLNQMCVTVVQAQLRMDKAMISDVIGRIGILVGTVFAVAKASDAHRLVAAVSAIVIGNLINLLVSYSFIRGQVKIRPRFVLGEWPALFVQILPMASLAVLGMIHFKADSIILTLYKPQVDVGIYGNAYKVLEILITLPAMFIGGLFPEMNQLFLKGKEGLTNLMQKALDLLIFAVVPVVTGIVLIAPHLIAILTRNYIPESARALQILAFAMIPLFIGTLMAHALLTAEKQKTLSIIELVAVVANISLNLYLIPHYTYFGAGSATVATETLTTILTTWITIRTLSFMPKLRVLWPALLGAAAMAGMYELVNNFAAQMWNSSYYDLSRLSQTIVILGVIAVGVIAYCIPFALLRSFPPVIQERLHARRNA